VKPPPIPTPQGAQLGNLQATTVSVGSGRCDNEKITAACTDKGMKPVCAHKNYNKKNACWPAPGKYANKHMAHPAYNRQVGLNPATMAGLCFFTGHKSLGALWDDGFSAHKWTKQTQPTTVIKGLDGKEWTAGEQDGAGWSTWCVKV